MHNLLVLFFSLFKLHWFNVDSIWRQCSTLSTKYFNDLKSHSRVGRANFLGQSNVFQFTNFCTNWLELQMFLHYTRQLRAWLPNCKNMHLAHIRTVGDMVNTVKILILDDYYSLHIWTWCIQTCLSTLHHIHLLVHVQWIKPLSQHGRLKLSQTIIEG